MNFTQEHWWKLSLRLNLRQSAVDAFQDFFSDVMQRLHGDDLVRVRPFGQKGDKGCDGYLQSTGQVYQCYGALNGNKGKERYWCHHAGVAHGQQFDIALSYSSNIRMIIRHFPLTLIMAIITVKKDDNRTVALT